MRILFCRLMALISSAVGDIYYDKHGRILLYTLPILTLLCTLLCYTLNVIILTLLGTQILMFQTQSAKVRSVHLCSASVLFTGSEDGRITRSVWCICVCMWYRCAWLCDYNYDSFSTLLPASLLSPVLQSYLFHKFLP